MNKSARLLVRIAWIFYTLALLTATHWPGLVVHGPVNWTDKIIHCGVFFVWTMLLYGAGLVAAGGVCACGRRRLIWTAVAGMGFAVFDETTQPMFSRVFDLLDLAADCLGVLLAVGLLWAGGRFWPKFRGDLGD